MTEKAATQVQQQPKNIYQRWNRVLAELESVEKAGVNKEQGNYKYMETPDLLKALRPLIAKHGLVLKANPAAGNGAETEISLGLAIEDSEYQSAQGKTMHYVRLKMEYLLVNVDDPSDCVALTGISDASDVADKALHKCRTSALKYMLRDNFMVDAQDPADADHDTHERGSSQRRMPAGRTFAGDEEYNPPKPIGKTLAGVVMEPTAQSDTERNWVEFRLNNFADPIISFNKADWASLKDGARVSVRVVQNTRTGGGQYWRAADVSLVAEPPTADRPRTFTEEMEGTNEPPAGVTAADVLKRMYPTPQDAKMRRMVGAAIEKLPLDVQRGAMLSFEKRIASEKPSTELGALNLLDISIQEAQETAAITAAEAAQ